MSINQIHLLGRCGQDPEIRSVGQNNVAKASFSLCTGGRYKTQDGREMDDTAWHNIVAWRGLADLAQKYRSLKTCRSHSWMIMMTFLQVMECLSKRY